MVYFYQILFTVLVALAALPASKINLWHRKECGLRGPE